MPESPRPEPRNAERRSIRRVENLTEALKSVSDGSMSESKGGSPFQTVLVLLLLIGGGWYFFNHYQIRGLDGLTVKPRSDEERASLIGLQDERLVHSPSDREANLALVWSSYDVSASTVPDPLQPISRDSSASRATPSGAAPRVEPIRVATWSLDGFGPTKLASPEARRTLCRVMRQFDVVALQQIASIERDLVARLVDAVNEGDPRYDFVLSKPTGPKDRPEHLAFVFDTSRLQVDRTQTYSLTDPTESVTYDPLVAWFRSAQATETAAWTFSLVNVRVDLANASAEVALLPSMLTAVRRDGRKEDDVVMLGLFQADDAYLRKILASSSHESVVRSGTTDIFGRHQTSNLIVDRSNTTESVGRSGAFDFLRVFNLSLAEAEAASSHLPVFAEFSPLEGGLR